MAEYNAEEREILRLSRAFEGMTGSEWWQEYAKILQSQIVTRERIALLPLSEKNPAFEGMDFSTRAASQETIKGAIIGLRLALAIPELTMKHAADIVGEHSPKDEADG